MKRLAIALAAVAALVIGATPLIAQDRLRPSSGQSAPAQAAPSGKPGQIDKKAREQGMAEAPAAVQAAKLACTVKDAYLVQAGVDPKTKAKSSTYEVACSEGPGYVVQAAAETKGFDCLMLEAGAKQDPKGAYTCKLPGNVDAKQGFVPLLTAAGYSCQPTAARYIGSAGSDAFYEFACQGDKGYVLQTSVGKTPVASDCLAVAGTNTECTLLTKEQVMSGVVKLAQASGKTCTVQQGRLVGVDPVSHGSYYEVGCGGGQPGFMIQSNAQGGFQNVIECAKAQSIANGCTYTVVDETAEAGTYTKLAQGAGFTCDVSRYRYLGKETKTNSELVELACKNRPDGAIALFPISGGKSQTFDCVQGGSLGVTCQLTQPNLVYTKYTDRLVAQGKTQCKVSGAKFLAQTTGGVDYIETACSDGLPGFVIAVDHNSGQTQELLTCGQVGRSGAACALPTNVAKK